MKSTAIRAPMSTSTQPLLLELSYRESTIYTILKAIGAAVALTLLCVLIYGVLLASVLLRMPDSELPLALSGSPSRFHSLFLTLPSNRSIMENLKEITKDPHIAGSPANHRAAEFVKSSFESYGFPSHIAEFHVLLSYPIHRSLSIVRPEIRHLSLQEEAIRNDPYSSMPTVPATFHAYSPSTTGLTARVVYANYGRTSDFDRLAELGVNCTGAIVLSRYGKIYRGDKVSNAHKAGGIASLVYSDPAESGGGKGNKPRYPDSEYLPLSGVQRGSISDIIGDPLTPGWPSVPGAEQIDVSDVELPPIPSLPISAEDALPILEAIGGDVAPADWWGALDLDKYSLGPGPVEVRLQLEMNLTVAPIENVIAVIRGAVEPHRYVIMGNHRDAWTFGAADPNSGTATLLEVARCLQKLVSVGWRPRRTIVMANWDAEEYALIGSSEWVEDNEALLMAQAVAYLNVDIAVSGSDTLFVGASPQLDSLLLSAAKMVRDPVDPTLSLFDRWNCSETWAIGRLGDTSSDYSAFLQHAGIPSLDFSFSDDYPMYHSLYDNFHWMSLYGDPGFHRHVAMAQFWGLVALLLADSPILPFNYSNYALHLQNCVAELEVVLEGAAAPSSVSTVALHSALLRLSEAAMAMEEQVQEQLLRGEEAMDPLQLQSINDRLVMAERGFLSPQGLPGRPWFRHLVYAPTADNGYGTTVFPGILDAVAVASDADSWKAVQHEVFKVARAIVAVAKVLNGELQ